MEVSCKHKSACSVEKGASSFDVLPAICGTISFMVSSLISVNFCNSSPRSFTVASEFMSTTNFFPLHVTEMLIMLDGVCICNLRVRNEATEQTKTIRG
uniref:Transmembrane protein n=1 Tax=Medicago truncatula TaxID=3880 RepID=I3S4I3_MEDTR|nr:unknown [Medicago truncatula]